jgi:AcrR family transcriptional regulator
VSFVPYRDNRRPRRRALDRPQIVGAALALLDEVGLDALTMRRLGDALGVEAMSLYRHVPGRAALLDGIHEAILGELGDLERARRGPWTEAVRANARAFRCVLVAHPNALVLFATRPAVTPASLVHVDRGLAILRKAGFSVGDALSAFQTIVTFVVGHALSTHAVVPSEDLSSVAYDAVEGLPALTEAAAILSERDLDAEFEFGLDALVRGLAARLAAKRA